MAWMAWVTRITSPIARQKSGPARTWRYMVALLGSLRTRPSFSIRSAPGCSDFNGGASCVRGHLSPVSDFYCSSYYKIIEII